MQQQFPQYGYQQQQYPQYGYNPQQQPIQNLQQARPPVTIAKRPTDGQQPQTQSSQVAGAPSSSGTTSEAPKAKVLSIGLDSTPKVEKTGQTKVLSIGSTAPGKSEPKSEDKKDTTDSGGKVAAVKAIQKTGEPVPSTTAAGAGKTSPAPSSGKDSPSGDDSKHAVKEADAVAKEQAVDVDEEILNEVYGKVCTD
jgi:peptide chain release factor subunit 3